MDLIMSENSLLNKLKELTEKELTKDVIMPLFKSLGFEKIEYYGGSYEEGKDVLCWKTDFLEETILEVIQVKKYKPSARSADTKSFGEVVTQLQQAIETSVPHTDGQSYRPSAVYFITPFQLETRALQTRFERFSTLKQCGVKIIEGSALVKLIIKKIPKVVNELLGRESVLSHTLMKGLSNEQLMNALNVSPIKDISTFYSDLDFGIGRIDTKFFFSLSLKPSSYEHKVKPEEWKSLKRRVSLTEEFFNVKILTPSFKEIESDFEMQNKGHKKTMKEVGELNDGIADLLSSLKILKIELETRKNKLGKISHEEKENLSKYYTELISNLDSLSETTKGKPPSKQSPEKAEKKIKKAKEKIGLIESKIFGDSPSIQTIDYYLENVTRIRSLLSRRKKLSEKLYEATYNFTIDCANLSRKIKNKQKWLHKQVEKFNSTKPSSINLKIFLEECQTLFEMSDKILSDRYISKALGIPAKQKYRDISTVPRFQSSIHDLFETGNNIVVLGEAGAGKTTSLQMYAKKKLEMAEENELVLFIPLAQSISLHEEGNEKKVNSPTKKFEDGIISYLRSQGIDINSSQLQESFEKRRTILLLDGIDESIKQARWIIEAVNGFAQRYPKMQLIVSSRMSVDILEEMPFLGITLLPFTNEQRELFIRNWFDKKDEFKVENMLIHISQYHDLGEIIRNPLLTTILCVLAENNVPLPHNEIRLYEEHLRLLLGQYDIHKKANRLNSLHHDLELVAQKAAYILHRSEMRHAEPQLIKTLVTNSLKDRMGIEQIEQAVTELYDPCNILVPMTNDGQLGFKHLRYQEFLAACELRSNRGIAIESLLSNSWWKGGLVFFAQMTDNIEYVFEHIAKYGRFINVRENLEAMLNVKPEREKVGLLDILNKNVEQDIFDEALDFLGDPIFDDIEEKFSEYLKYDL